MPGENRRDDRPLIIGVDPGFSSIGICRAIAGERIEPIEFRVIRTKKSQLKILTREDNLSRCDEICAELDLAFCGAAIVCAEGQSWPRNAANSAKLGMFWGILARIAWEKDIQILQASPMDVKRAVTGKKNSTKEEMISSLEEMFDLPPWPEQKTLREHAADALGAIVACQNFQSMRTIRRHHEVRKKRK